jgi:hypothetical protein
MSVPILLIVGAGGWPGCAVSIYFNLRQHYRIKHQEEGLKRQEENVRQEKVEREHKELEARDEQRLKEQAAPLFSNFDGTPGPILVNGSQHSSQGPFMYLWGLVTVVNRHCGAYEDHPASAPHGRRGMACSKHFLPLEIQYPGQIRPN